MINLTTRLLYLRKKKLVPVELQVGCVEDWTFWCRENLFSLPGYESQAVHSVAHSLHQLRYLISLNCTTHANSKGAVLYSTRVRERRCMCPWRRFVSMSVWQIKPLHVATDYPSFNVSTASLSDICNRAFYGGWLLVLG